MSKEKKMVDERSWDEFRENGLLWFINTILHVFGWAIVVELDDDNKVKRVYPARVKFRGFSETSTTKGYKRLTKYMLNNVHNLIQDIEE